MDETFKKEAGRREGTNFERNSIENEGRSTGDRGLCHGPKLRKMATNK